MARTKRKNADPAPKGAGLLDSLPLFAAESPRLSPQKGGSRASKKDPLEVVSETEKALAKREEEKEATREGREISLRYYERKQIVLTHEKKNQTEMIFFKTPSGTWYKAVEKSAVYFVMKYGKMVESKAKLQIDKDYKFISKTGCVSIPNIDNLVKKLETIGVKLASAKDDIYIFKLPERITGDEYNLMREQSRTTIERANKMIRPKDMMPNLMEDAKEIFTIVFWTFRDMNEQAKRIIGDDFAMALRDIVIGYTEMAKTKGEPKEFLEMAMQKVTEADGYFMAVSPLRIIKDDKLLQIAEGLMKLRNQIVFEQKKIAVKEINDKNRGKTV